MSAPLDLLTELVATAEGRCAYAEARFVHTREEGLAVRNGLVDDVEAQETAGVGIRVRVGGSWGFAATNDVTPSGLERALAEALALAEAQPRVPEAPLAPVAPATGHWVAPHERDALEVPLEERLALLLAADEAMRGDQRIARTEATLMAARIEKAFASTEGAACTQLHVECGAGIAATAVGGDELQTRSYPMAHGGLLAQAGWEHVAAMELAAHAPRVAAEAVELLTAPELPEGRRTVVLGGEQLALQVHESVGHALELDRIQLGEASYAGTSWVGAQDVREGALRYGSEQVSITADATLPLGLGTFGWDDEGVAGHRTPLVVDGVLRAALSDRTSAAALGLDASAGCARADGFARQPIVRMTNVSIEPGAAGSLDDLLADTEDGALFLETNRSWSIDDRRWHFQFGTEVAREVRGGELGRLYRNGSYAGITPQFWGSCDAVCGPQAWRPWGIGNCGKGEPGQVMRVSHGTAPARFRDVQVGVA
ncbi:TldD/PmbA family protein [Conexibacter sp. SYSU D00693]|uniref:TldD/PmbA family protein n=1 Tax=Conexibacter sp. SYSU D00693 TaxID=2812560 RepID=UPI00196A46BD|nr:TldD/PmbA family protein [Conexibacter sp. SYSU D00693]